MPGRFSCASIVWKISLSLIACFLSLTLSAMAQERRAPATGRAAIVVDERLAALRDEPRLTARLRQRLGRGRVVAITGTKRTPDGLYFYRVAVTRRTRGWLPAESVVSSRHGADDEKLLRLIRASEGFDRLSRARIFLDVFPRSSRRPTVLWIYGESAEQAAEKLSRDAVRRLDEREMAAGGAPAYSYFMNYSGLDRYNRQGIAFIFDRAARAFHYDGASWREIVRRYPRSPEASAARKRLDSLSAAFVK